MREKQIISSTGLLLAATLAVAAVIIVNATFTNLRVDLTENRLFTLSDGSINIIRSLKEPISLDFYFSKKTLVGYPALMNYGTRVRDLLEAYAAKSKGQVKLTIIEPEPFSEAEDQAVASGLQGVAVNAAGDRAYFGLVGTNATDDEKTIPFFHNNREASLEYDITKLIYNLANPKKRVVGVISDLPVFAGANPDRPTPWAIIKAMREFFQVQDLGKNIEAVESNVDVLMVIHPKNLSDKTLLAIDQYLLGGGKAMLFVDPLAEADHAKPDPQNPMVMPDLDSDLKPLFDAWGIEVPAEKLVADINAAMRVQTRSARGPQEALYLPWLRLGESSFNKDDFSTSELEVIHFGTAGSIQLKEGATLELLPLIQTGLESMQLERDLILIQRDPNVILENFKSENRKYTLAARISGQVKTAFPEGVDDRPAKLKEGNINAIVVSDTDILNDMFWIRTQSYFGVEVPQPIANNGDFVINSLENLSGNTDLISLRSRGGSSRPFTRVETIRRAAEDEFREREKALQAKLEQTEKRILELQRDAGGGELILSSEQTQEIEKFRLEQVKTRKELRAVQHELQKNIERLGTQLKFINIGLIPLLIMLAAIATVAIRVRRERRS